MTSENIAPETEKGIEIGLKRWRGFQLNQGRSASTVDKHIDRFNNEYFPILVKQHLDLLKTTGFQVVELFWFSYMQAGFYAIK